MKCIIPCSPLTNRRNLLTYSDPLYVRRCVANSNKCFHLSRKKLAGCDLVVLDVCIALGGLMQRYVTTNINRFSLFHSCPRLCTAKNSEGFFLPRTTENVSFLMYPSVSCKARTRSDFPANTSSHMLTEIRFSNFHTSSVDSGIQRLVDDVACTVFDFVVITEGPLALLRQLYICTNLEFTVIVIQLTSLRTYLYFYSFRVENVCLFQQKFAFCW